MQKRVFGTNIWKCIFLTTLLFLKIISINDINELQGYLLITLLFTNIILTFNPPVECIAAGLLAAGILTLLAGQIKFIIVKHVAALIGAATGDILTAFAIADAATDPGSLKCF